ncbi:MAG TPA: type II secretion system protein GspG [Firmicutes bacterium]|jgi:general secretion pathway protein G|nr:type II secretion system protein GspG [Bacillota bacterium]
MIISKDIDREDGYTLIEILAVLTLLAFIITMVAPNIINSLQSGQIKAARSQIGSTENVLNSYYLDTSSYPTTEQGLKALIEKPTAPPTSDSWNGPYIQKNKIPVDPWGHELHYKSPGDHNSESYDLYSLGKDNAEGGSGANADIGNW